MTNKNHSNIELRRIVEYKHFFIEEEHIDVDSILKQYDRSVLVRMAIILSCHYGNLSMPDNSRTLFSIESHKYIDKLNRLFKNFYNQSGIPKGSKVVISTFRTVLELWRHIFAIRAEEYKGTIAAEDVEYNLFKVLLTINEQIVDFTHDDKKYQLDELLFLNQFITNDTNSYNFQGILQPQLYYLYHLVQLCEKNDVMRKASETLFRRWGISSWKQYVATLMYLANQTEEYRKDQHKGVPVINPQKLEDNDETGLFSSSLVEALSIDEEEYIPFEDPSTMSSSQNIDYRAFRSRPFVRFKKNDEYAVINIQLLCERIFNSLYFDFMPLINGKKGSVGFFDYNKDFVEKELFRTTIFNCIPPYQFTFPSRNGSSAKEDKGEPDFYSRKNSNLIIVECKAIKMNGSIRDDGDYRRLLDELHEKIVIKTKNLDPSRKEVKKEEFIGIGQLIRHIEAIDSDAFQWDNNIPNEVTYYPIIVFEDVRILQPGLLSILNRWFNEEMTKKDDFGHILQGCMPVMAISINTLYLYDDLIKRRDLPRIIDQFVRTHSAIGNEGNVILYEDADFDAYLRNNPFQKNNTFGKWITSK